MLWLSASSSACHGLLIITVITQSPTKSSAITRPVNWATIADMRKRQRDVAELDARYTKELADANATIESLRVDVSAGRKRLQVAATCAKSTTGASGMGDGESPRLTADAELNYYRLRSGIDKITAQVNYLQEYIRTQCLK